MTTPATSPCRLGSLDDAAADSAPASPALAAYLYANDLSIHELLENHPWLEIDDLPASLRMAQGLAVELSPDERS
jgi:hypothetical protein